MYKATLSVLFTLLILLSQNVFAGFNFESEHWLALLRYKKGFFDYESEVDDPSYFLHKKGKKNPELEFNKTVLLMSEETNVRQDGPICLFPARALLLEKNGVIKLSFPLEKCDEYRKLKEKIKLASVSLIFSSYFIDSPASAFGHTFFRLRSRDSSKQNNDLLDYGVDFSAQVTTKNPIVYGVLGILGGFKGKFSLMPYYVKVREYNDMESRDLWDYEINLTDYEKDFFIAHLIEMERAYFNYFYFSENCSYHVLGFLNAIKPTWNLMDKLKTFVPPVDTIYALASSPDAIKTKRYRPSVFSELKVLSSKLSEVERSRIKLLLAGDISIKEVIDQTSQKNKKRNILDFYSKYLDFTLGKDLRNKNSKKYKMSIQKKLETNLLRSQITMPSDKLDFLAKYDQSPDLGHKTARFQLGYFYNHESSQKALTLEARFALHDWLDFQKGFIPFSSSELGKLNLNIFEDYIRLERFTLVNVEAIRPIEKFFTPTSWNFSFGVRDNVFSEKQDYIQYLNFSYGYTLRHSGLVFTGYLFTELNYGDYDENKFGGKLGPKAKISYYYRNLILSSSATRTITTSDSLKYSQNLDLSLKYNFSLNTGLLLNFIDVDHQQRSKISFAYHF